MTTVARRYLLALLLGVAIFVVALRHGSYDDVARGEAFFLAWWVLGLSVAFGLLPRVRPPRSAQLAVGALIAMAAWAALGASWSDGVARTLHEAARTIGFAGVLLLVVWSFGPRSWSRGVAALTIAAVAICCLAFYTRLSTGVLSDPLRASGFEVRRLGFPFGYWNATGVWAAMTVGLALPWSAHARSRWLRAPALSAVCVAVPVAYLSYSRSAAVGLVLATVTVVALSRHRWLVAFNAAVAGVGSAAVIHAIRAQPEIARGIGTAGRESVAATLAAAVAGCAVVALVAHGTRLERIRVPLRVAHVAAVAVAIAAVVGSVAVGPALADKAWESFHQPERVSPTADPAQRLRGLSGERVHLWEAALNAFHQQPIKGQGAGTYELLWNRDENWTHHVLDAHSLYLETLAELGIPGTLLLALALGPLLLAAVRAPFRQAEAMPAGAAAGCAAALVSFCVAAGVDWMWESTAVTVAAICCGGLALASGARGSPGLSRAARALFIALALAALALRAPGLLAASEVKSSQRAVRDGREEDAVVAATTAIKAEPWGPAGYLQRALVLEREGFLDAAADDARTATDKEPTNGEYWLILARIHAERGAGHAAIAAANRARELNPSNPIFGQ